MAKSRDLFDDSTMSFGEHLEVLRVHLWKGIIGLVVCVIVALFFGNHIIDVVSAPIDRQLAKFGKDVEVQRDVQHVDFWARMKGWVGWSEPPEKQPAKKESPSEPQRQVDPSRGEVLVSLEVRELARLLHEAYPDRFPAPPQNPPDDAENRTVPLILKSPSFKRFEEAAVSTRKPVTLNVQEAFLTYLKVAFVAGLVLASPWIFYQLWLFVAAGLYPHERRYVHIYLPTSIVLFVGGALFCFFAVFPFVLKFLLGFNEWLGLQPQIRLSEWVTFAIMLPLMFGVSFQLPLVMLFLERISIFEIRDYREKRRMAILVIAILSMFLTPADPMSMMLMMLPLIGLYEFGIWLCGFSPKRSPFEEAEAA